jgi:hypothetical protein
MKTAKVDNAEKYIGLYLVDFGEYSSVGFTAQEVAEILESERFADAKVYKIHNAYPDGKLELVGVNREIFQLESGMFFYSSDPDVCRKDFDNLVKLAVENPAPCRAKLHRSCKEKLWVTAIIYPAEYEDDISRWLTQGKYVTSGSAEAGSGAVQRYYDNSWEIVEKRQIFSRSTLKSRTGQQLYNNLRATVQR